MSILSISLWLKFFHNCVNTELCFVCVTVNLQVENEIVGFLDVVFSPHMIPIQIQGRHYHLDPGFISNVQNNTHCDITKVIYAAIFSRQHMKTDMIRMEDNVHFMSIRACQIMTNYGHTPQTNRTKYFETLFVQRSCTINTFGKNTREAKHKCHFLVSHQPNFLTLSCRYGNLSSLVTVHNACQL